MCVGSSYILCGVHELLPLLVCQGGVFSLRPTRGSSCHSRLCGRAWNWNQNLDFILVLLC